MYSKKGLYQGGLTIEQEEKGPEGLIDIQRGEEIAKLLNELISQEKEDEASLSQEFEGLHSERSKL